MPIKRRSFFEDFLREFEEMDEMFERMFAELREYAPELKPGEPIYYGFSINVGPSGVPEVKTFGNIKQSPSGLAVGEREPFADVIVDEKNAEAIVTVEMPGVSKEDIKISATENSIEVRADGEKRRYFKTMPLEVEIDPATCKATYNNGVLEVKAKLKKPAKRGVEIKVD